MAKAEENVFVFVHQHKMTSASDFGMKGGIQSALKPGPSDPPKLHPGLKSIRCGKEITVHRKIYLLWRQQNLFGTPCLFLFALPVADEHHVFKQQKKDCLMNKKGGQSSCFFVDH